MPDDGDQREDDERDDEQTRRPRAGLMVLTLSQQLIHE
jgi:hypothetical protein